MRTKKLNRPLCLECGSGEVISKGTMWLCKECGRWWSKIRRRERFIRYKEDIKLLSERELR